MVEKCIILFQRMHGRSEVLSDGEINILETKGWQNSQNILIHTPPLSTDEFLLMS